MIETKKSIDLSTRLQRLGADFGKALKGGSVEPTALKVYEGNDQVFGSRY